MLRDASIATEGPAAAGRAELLGAGLTALGLDRCPVREAALLRYLDLLLRWNRIYNLTSVTHPELMVRRHLLDSLAAIPHLSGRSFVDVGTGAGLPGIPLAVWLPDRKFCLLDSSGKKTHFLQQVKIELCLHHVDIVQTRVERWRPPQRFDTILSRAFASLPELVGRSGHLLAPGGSFYAFKGNWPEPADSALDDDHQILCVHRLHIPGEPANRHLIQVGARGNRVH